jgi:hypothetical protein
MADLPLILVINMQRDTTRWQTLSSALTAQGLPYARVPGIDARRHWHLVQTCIPRPYVSPVQGRPLTPGECCCVLSHLAALKRVVRLAALSTEHFVSHVPDIAQRARRRWRKSNDFGHLHYRKNTANDACNPNLNDYTSRSTYAVRSRKTSFYGAASHPSITNLDFSTVPDRRWSGACR